MTGLGPQISVRMAWDLEELSLATRDLASRLSTVVRAVHGAADRFGQLASGPASAIGALVMGAALAHDQAVQAVKFNTGLVGPALSAAFDQVERVRALFPASGVEAAGVLDELGDRLGIEGPEVESLSVACLQLARVTGWDVGDAVVATSRMMNAWSLQGQARHRSLDLLLRVSQASGVSVAQLTQLLTAAGPQLQAAGLGLDDAAIWLGGLARSGRPLEQAIGALGRAVKEMAHDGLADPKVLAAAHAEAAAAAERLETAQRALGAAIDASRGATDASARGAVGLQRASALAALATGGQADAQTRLTRAHGTLVQAQTWHSAALEEVARAAPTHVARASEYSGAQDRLESAERALHAAHGEVTAAQEAVNRLAATGSADIQIDAAHARRLEGLDLAQLAADHRVAELQARVTQASDRLAAARDRVAAAAPRTRSIREQLLELEAAMRSARSPQEAMAMAQARLGKSALLMADIVLGTGSAISDVRRAVSRSRETVAGAYQSSRTLSDRFAELTVQVQRAIRPLAVALVGVLERMVPRIQAVAGVVERVVQAFLRLDPQAQQALLALVVVVGAMGPALVIIGSMVLNVAALARHLMTTGRALVRVARAGWSVAQRLDRIGRTLFASGWTAVGRALRAARAALNAKVRALGLLGRILAGRRSTTLTLVPDVQTSYITLKVAHYASRARPAILWLSDRLGDVLVELADRGASAAASAAGSVWRAMATLAQLLGRAARTAFSRILDAFVAMYRRLRDGLLGAIDKINDRLNGAVTRMELDSRTDARPWLRAFVAARARQADLWARLHTALTPAVTLIGSSSIEKLSRTYLRFDVWAAYIRSEAHWQMLQYWRSVAPDDFREHFKFIGWQIFVATIALQYRRWAPRAFIALELTLAELERVRKWAAAAGALALDPWRTGKQALVDATDTALTAAQGWVAAVAGVGPVAGIDAGDAGSLTAAVAPLPAAAAQGSGDLDLFIEVPDDLVDGDELVAYVSRQVAQAVA